MSITKNIIGFLALSSITAMSQQIREIKIDEKSIINLNVSNENPCTLVFPFPLSVDSVSGGSITGNIKEENSPANFYLSYASNSPVMDLRSLTDVEGESTFMNITHNQKEVYVVKINFNNSNFDSSVKLKLKSEGTKKVSTFTPQMGSALLERTNIYPLLKKADSPLIEGSQLYLIDKKYTYPNKVDLTVETGVKWNEPQMIVLSGFFQSTRKAFYDRSSIQVQVGDKIMHASIIHASGVVTPGKPNRFQIGISDTDYPEVRNIDMTENEFKILMTFEERPIDLHQSLLPVPTWDSEEFPKIERLPTK